MTPGRVDDSLTKTGRVLGLPRNGRVTCHVSNGERIVRVSHDGAFALPFAPDRHRFVFVIPPDGYVTEGRFWHTTDLGATMPEHPQFTLRRIGRHRNHRFEFLHATDCHLRSFDHQAVASQFTKRKRAAPAGQAVPAAAHLRRTLQDLVARAPQAAFMVVTGDITDMGQPGALRAAARILSELPIPVFPVFGGHDGNTERLRNGGNDHYNVEGFSRHLAPPYYAWHWGGRHFVSLISETHFLDEQTRDHQAAFLAADLKRFGRSMPVTVCAHKHPYPWSIPPFRRTRADSWLHGHFHSGRVYDDADIRVFSTPPPAMGAFDQCDIAARVIVCNASRKPASRSVKHSCRHAPATTGRRRPRGPRLKMIWRSDVHALSRIAKPCVVGDVLYAGISDVSTDRHGGVAAIDMADGGTRWRVELGESVEAPVTAHEDSVIAVTQTGRIARLARRDGRVLWQQDMPEKQDRWVYGQPAVLEGHRSPRVVVGGTAMAVCLDARTGRVRWKHAHETTTSDAMGRMQGPIAHRGRVFFAGMSTPCLLMEGATGRTIRWVGDRTERFVSPATRIDDVLFVGSAFGALHCIDAFTGRPRWARQISKCWIASAAAPWHDAIVVGTAEGIGRYSIRNGRRLAFRSFDRDMTLLVPNRTPCRSCASPCAAGAHLFVASGDGHINVLTGRRLDLVTRHAWSEPIIGAMACAPDGRTVFINAKGQAVCVRLAGA